MFGLDDLTPTTLNPVTITKNAVGSALEVLDNTLYATAEYAERGNHLLTPLTNQTELQLVDDDGGRHSYVAKAIDVLREQIKNGLPIENGLQDTAALVDALITSKFEGGQDDRKFLLESVLVFLSRYPNESIFKKNLTDKVITVLYNDLPHPPQAIVGRKSRYRSADGAGTALWNPDMGKANTPYARSVQGTHPLPANELPSPELVFDALLKRERPVEHPAGLSSHFFAFANLVIHQLFWTKHHDEHAQDPVNLTSSYLDLSIVYGNSEEDQKSVRVSDGTGKIHNDCFGDYRVALMPPSTAALCILFSRNHNYICERLLEINENKTFENPPPQDQAAKDKQDEDLFQTARLVNSGFFMQTILADYLAAILGLVREGNSWSLDPLSEFRNQDHSVSERGTGNVVSIEFAALYHFHASISQNDEKWAEKLFGGLFPEVGKNWDEITPKKYKERLEYLRNRSGSGQPGTNPNNGKPPSSSGAPGGRRYPNFWSAAPKEWDIFWADGPARDATTGKYADADLAKILQDATAHSASAFKARGTPHVMRVIEWMAIEQNRTWGTCSLNAFRKFLGLKPYKTFEEWNPIPEIADAARRLYGHPDNLELYPGLQAEEAKPKRAGAGLCASFTMTRAILADAVALVRGDRFLTTDFTTFNLTAWGYNDAIRNSNNSANGGTLCKLLMRTLPDYYPDDNAYTLFPLMDPVQLRKDMAAEGIAHKYQWDRPVPRKPLKVVRDWATAKEALQNPCLAADYPMNANLVFSGDNGYLQMMNETSASNSEIDFIKAQFAGSNDARKHADYIFLQTGNLIKSKSYSLVGNGKRSVDIVRDVLVNLPTRFVADMVLGLPLKTEDHPIGSLFEHELSEKLRDIYNFVFLQNDPTTHLARRESVKDTVDYLSHVTAHHWSSILSIFKLDLGIIAEKALSIVSSHHVRCHDWLRRLKSKAGARTDRQLLNDAVSLAVLLGAEYSQLLVHCLDSLLPSNNPSSEEEGKDAQLRFKEVVEAARQSTTDTAGRNKFREQIVDALRRAPVIPGIYRSVVSENSELPFSRDDRIYVSVSDAQINWGKPEKKADPSSGKTASGPCPLTPENTGILPGDGLIKLLGHDYVIDTLLVPALRPILSLKDLGRAQGNSGRLNSFDMAVDRTDVDEKGEPTAGSEVKVRSYLDRNYIPSPWSRNMVVTYRA